MQIRPGANYTETQLCNNNRTHSNNTAPGFMDELVPENAPRRNTGTNIVVGLPLATTGKPNHHIHFPSGLTTDPFRNILRARPGMIFNPHAGTRNRIGQLGLDPSRISEFGPFELTRENRNEIKIGSTLRYTNRIMCQSIRIIRTIRESFQSIRIVGIGQHSICYRLGAVPSH